MEFARVTHRFSSTAARAGRSLSGSTSLISSRTGDARDALEDLGYDVLETAVPRLEVYAQSFGMPIPSTGREIWRRVANDLIARCAPLCPVRS